MKDKTNYPEVVVNIPTKPKYYLDAGSIILVALIVSGIIIYVGSQLK